MTIFLQIIECFQQMLLKQIYLLFSGKDIDLILFYVMKINLGTRYHFLKMYLKSMQVYFIFECFFVLNSAKRAECKIIFQFSTMQ